MVKPDPAFEPQLTTRNGNINPGGIISCSVGVDDQLINWDQLLLLVSSATNRQARIVGTWCDDDDTARTVICPLALLAIEYELETYDINGWPVPVRDFDLFAFAHAVGGLAALGQPHAGESRSLTLHLPFPFRPSVTAIPFARAYAPTRVDHVDAATFTNVDVAGIPQLEVTIETGAPANGKGFFATQVGLTFDEPELDNYCPPGICDLDGVHCAHDGTTRYTRIPPYLPIARKGDLALSPGDGRGFVSLIVASLNPAQVFDHMGIFVDNGWTIRHVTSSQERLEDEDLFTSEITVKFAGVIELNKTKVPLNGFRPDLIRFGWPGAISQTVEEVFRTGRNTLNSRWTFAANHPGQDIEDPERLGEQPPVRFRIYHLPRAARERRLEFNDPERDKSESVVRLQEASVRLVDVWQACPQDIAMNVGPFLLEFTSRLVRPHSQFDLLVRPALELVADMARKMESHYRVFSYSKGDISLDPAFVAPAANDPGWESLPSGARWPAGSIPSVCSSFVWTAIQLANRNRPAGMLPIVMEDRASPPDPNCGREYGTADGFYQYHTEERLNAATKLFAKIQQKIRDRFDSKVSEAAYTAVPALELYRELTALNVGNQLVNAFAFDACEKLDETWRNPGEGETASPNDVIRFWDLKPHAPDPAAPNHLVLVQPEGSQAIYGDSVPLMLSREQWLHMPMFRKQVTDLGTGHVLGVAFVSGHETAGVTVRFDFGCVTATTTADKERAISVDLGTGVHFADAFIVLPNPVTGNQETFRTPQQLRFEVKQGQDTHIELSLEPPSDLWRIIDVHLDADIHDKSFFGGDADSHHFNDAADDRHFELRQDLDDEVQAPENQQNTVLHHEETFRTEPEVGSGVHVAVAIVADLNPADRSVRCQCDVALIDSDNGGFLGIGTSVNVDQLEHRDVTIPADATVDVLTDINFASDETVPERAAVSLRLTNRRRPS